MLLTLRSFRCIDEKMSKLRSAAVVAVRAFGTSVRQRSGASLKDPFHQTTNKGVYPDSKGYEKVLRLQKEWAADSSTMVWQKKGTVDTLPYTLTLAGCALGVGLSLYMIIIMSFPNLSKKAE